jgi:signal transduction histidine kinase
MPPPAATAAIPQESEDGFRASPAAPPLTPGAEERTVRAFRAKLLAAMTLVAAVLTGASLLLIERRIARETEQGLQRSFEAELAFLKTVRDLRHATLAERCRSLVRKSRIHAALEDDALDLLYPSARDELKEVMTRDPAESSPADNVWHAKFYRFLDIRGAVIPTHEAPGVGPLAPADEQRLRLPELPREQQFGCLVRAEGVDGGEPVEIIATPIISAESNEPIAALVVGFKPADTEARETLGMKSGLWLDERLHLPTLPGAEQALLGQQISRAISETGDGSSSFTVEVGGVPHLLFYQQLNSGSLFPPVYEVGLYSLADPLARQSSLRWQVLGSGAALLLLGVAASLFVSARLARPVGQLAAMSRENRTLRERAESALETTSAELQRAARFSADASHQLKTPVTVLRAGLDEVLASETLAPAVREEIELLVHQTFRLTSIIEDLLLLSRLDSGRMQLELAPVNLGRIIETCVEDLGLVPDAPPLDIETEVPPSLPIAGEQRYTMIIVQNLLENARKYNRPHGRIRVVARQEGPDVFLSIANTGTPIPPHAREHIFERFHRGAMGETVPGHGLGLNLARELAHIHGGHLLLKRSDEAWTEFEVRFRAAAHGANPSPGKQ